MSKLKIILILWFLGTLSGCSTQQGVLNPPANLLLPCPRLEAQETPDNLGLVIGNLNDIRLAHECANLHQALVNWINEVAENSQKEN